MLPPAKSGGGPRKTDPREAVNALLCTPRSGCSWWKSDGTLERVRYALVVQTRKAAGRNPKPSAAIIDSRSVKTTEKRGHRGYDAGKNVNGRKRRIIADTRGLALAAVHPADVQDRDGARAAMVEAAKRFDIRKARADGAYRGKLAGWMAREFTVLPKRWAVERTFGWLSNDYEGMVETSVAWIRLAMSDLTLRRLAAQQGLSNTL